MRRLTLPLVFLCLCESGCLPRQRFNKNCEWTQDVARRLDLHNSRDQQHLVEDAQLAEELAIRYSDFKHKELTGYEGHGGYLQQGQVTRGCIERMFSEIERAHGVTRQQIFEARMYRDWRFDFAVILSFAFLYLSGTMWLCRILARRFRDSGARVWIAAVVLSSIPVSLIGLELLQLWSFTAEMIRVGNDHLGGFRAAKIPWFGHHWGGLFMFGILLFCIVGWLRGLLPGTEEQGSSDVGGPQGVVLH